HRLGARPHLHPFPTRRSSDLIPSFCTWATNTSISFSRSAASTPIFAIPYMINNPPSSRSNGKAETAKAFCWLSTNSLVNREELRSEEHTSELQSRENLVCRLL